MGDEGAASLTGSLAVAAVGLCHWSLCFQRQYVRLRWLTVGAILLGTLVARTWLGIGVPLFPVLSVTTAIAFYNVLFSALKPGATTRWGQRLAFAQVVVDIIALTVLLHFLGGVETPFFLVYLFYVGMGSVLLSRKDAYRVMALAIALFVLLIGAEFLGWLPHVHLEGLVPPDLYRERAYVAAVVVGFVMALAVSTVGITTIVASLTAELRHRCEQQVQANERELEEISQKLAELDRMRVFFLGLASHDIKTPLAVIASYLQVILDGFVGEIDVNSEKQRRWMERANVRVLELIRLVNDFLDVSQLAPERVLVEMEPVALSDVVQRSIEEVRARAEEKGVTLRLELVGGGQPEDARQLRSVYAAPRRLQQVITNLLDNAVKFSPRQGEVVLKVCQHGDGVQVEVVDAGPGIPALYMDHVFEDYFRARRKEFVPGAGLGLSTARKIVEAHGGQIWVESPCFEDGKGSRFMFTLPPPPQPPPGGGERGGSEE
jgi:signal transduction histidine kinase